MEVSVAFPTALDSHENIALAEELGYARAWLYDTPQNSPDVWMALALAAERTSRIGLGPGVLVPSLRHPMVNAAATAALVGLAPGRVSVAFGTGFSGRRAMGYRGIKWAFMADYIRPTGACCAARWSSGRAPRCRCSTRPVTLPRGRSTCRS